MKRRELFKLGLAASIAHVLPKPRAMTYDPSKVRITVGGHELTCIASGQSRFDPIQRTRSYNRMVVHSVGGRR